jgi:lipopolysaccharide cholinephosphotransferase
MPVTPTPHELRQIQLTELELLKEVDRICRKSKITYRISAGTLLGAVRHGGFIPWDDDADLIFLRKDYERFRIACKTELGKDYYIQDQRSTKGYRWGYGKLRRKDTLFVRDGQEHMPYKQGIFIDLFVYDYVPDAYPLRTLYAIIGFLFRKAFWAEIGQYTAKGFEKLCYHYLALIPERRLKELFYDFMHFFCNKKTHWLRAMTFPPPNKNYGFPAELWNGVSEIMFEGHKFLTFKNPDAYLQFRYGDYMTLPPEKERKCHPVSKLLLLSEENK